LYSTIKNMGALSSFAHFVYDSETKTVLGRNFESWLKITIFYCIYYSCIGAFAWYFVGGYQAKFMTLPDQSEQARPNTQNRVATPGLATYPKLEKINLDANRQNAVEYMDQINDYLMRYANDSSSKKDVAPAKLGKCSPVCVSGDECEETPLLRSYEEGEPCIVYSLNKVIGWRPFPMESLNAEYIQPRNPGDDSKSMVGSAVDRYNPDEIYVFCYDLDVANGFTSTDDKLDRFEVTYYSSDEGIDQSHDYGVISNKNNRYPMWKPAEVKNAFVAAKIKVKEAYLGQNINVACQAYAGGLAPNKAQNAAMAVTIVNVEAAGSSSAVKINDAYHG
jgi:hypothetical protein